MCAGLEAGGGARSSGRGWPGGTVLHCSACQASSHLCLSVPAQGRSSMCQHRPEAQEGLQVQGCVNWRHMYVHNGSSVYKGLPVSVHGR